jgi:predicted patatin/cPLA2 family phospholipase
MKTAWIFPGGAARAVYTAGAVYALSESGFPKPEMIISCSGSIGTSMCYVAEQKEVIKNVWCKLLSSRKFLSFARFWRILDIDYLVDDCLKKENPLDMDKIRASSIDMLFPLTQARSGHIDYFSNRSGQDLYEIIRAGCQVPFWTNLFSLKGIMVGEQYYADSGPVGRYQVHVQKAIEAGAERVVVFDNWLLEDNSKPYLFIRIFMWLRNREYRKNQSEYYRQMTEFAVPSGIKFLRLAPKRGLGMSRWDIDNANANKVFDRGYQDLIESKELSEFYSSK